MSALFQNKKENITNNNESELIFVVNSHVNYYKKTCPRLIESFTNLNKISKNQIIVIVGGNDHNKKEIINGIQYRFVTHNSFDHTSIIEILESDDLNNEFYCIIHDTCEAGPKFYEQISKFNKDYEYNSIDVHGWMNMGVFKKEALIKQSNYILKLKNCSKVRAMMSEKLYMRLFHSTALQKESFKIIKESNIYSNINRQVLYFANVDLYKYLANHTKRKGEITTP